MISALLMTMVLAQAPTSYDPPIERQVVASQESVILAGLNNRGCYTSYTQGYVTTGTVVQGTSLYLTLQNIPGGTETSRQYVRCKVHDQYYTLPVINGYLPTVTTRSTNDLILNYGASIVYDPKLYGLKGYIVFQSATTTRSPEAVKTFEGVQQTTTTTNAPSGLHHPDLLEAPTQKKTNTIPSNQEIDTLLNPGRPTQTLEGPKGVDRPSDSEIDGLLRPSSVLDTSRGIPRY